MTGDAAGPDPAGPPRVLIADDQTLVRTGFRMILRDAGIPVVAEAADGAAAVAAAAQHHPDVVLMDVRMPELDGLDATRRILAAEPDCRIIILTTFDLDQYVYAALASGASGFLLKHVSPEYLITAIRLVRTGDALLARGLSNAELAAQLVLSEATVKTHVARILAKLQLRDRVQAVVLAYETGLVTPAGQPAGET